MVIRKLPPRVERRSQIVERRKNWVAGGINDIMISYSLSPQSFREVTKRDLTPRKNGLVSVKREWLKETQVSFERSLEAEILLHPEISKLPRKDQIQFFLNGHLRSDLLQKQNYFIMDEKEIPEWGITVRMAYDPFRKKFYYSSTRRKDTDRRRKANKPIGSR